LDQRDDHLVVTTLDMVLEVRSDHDSVARRLRLVSAVAPLGRATIQALAEEIAAGRQDRLRADDVACLEWPSTC
jgi:hypothetical protein